MAGNDGSIREATSPTMTSAPSDTALVRVLVAVGIFALAIFAVYYFANNYLPGEAEANVLSILFKVAAIGIIVMLPILDVFAWKRAKSLPRDGFLGFMLTIVGAGVFLHASAIVLCVAAFIPTLLPPPLFSAILLIGSVVAGIGAVITLLGIVFVAVFLVCFVLRQIHDRQ